MYERQIKRKGEKERRCDEGLKNARNYHGICITSRFQGRAGEQTRARSLALLYPSIAIDTATLSQMSLPAWMAKTFATLDGGKGNDSSQLFNSSGKLVYLERRSLLLELSWFNTSYRQFLRVYTRHIRTHVGIVHDGYDSYWPFCIQENLYFCIRRNYTRL